MIAGGCVSEIFLFQKRNSQSSQCCISSDADSVDPATHNHNIVLVCAQPPQVSYHRILRIIEIDWESGAVQIEITSRPLALGKLPG